MNRGKILLSCCIACAIAGTSMLLPRSAHAQRGGDPPAPTIVWYGTAAGFNTCIFRAWSDGTVEMKRVQVTSDPALPFCSEANTACASPWIVISDPTEGLSAKADCDRNGEVNGADLSILLASWGPAPKDPMPWTDCPMGLMQ